MGEDGSWKQKNHVPETRISYREKILVLQVHPRKYLTVNNSENSMSVDCKKRRVSIALNKKFQK